MFKSVHLMALLVGGPGTPALVPAPTREAYLRSLDSHEQSRLHGIAYQMAHAVEQARHEAQVARDFAEMQEKKRQLEERVRQLDLLGNTRNARPVPAGADHVGPPSPGHWRVPDPPAPPPGVKR